MKCWGVEKFCIFSNKVAQKLLIKQCALNTNWEHLCTAWTAGETCHAEQEECESWQFAPAQLEGSCRLLLWKNDIGITKLHRLGVCVH